MDGEGRIVHTSVCACSKTLPKAPQLTAALQRRALSGNYKWRAHALEIGWLLVLISDADGWGALVLPDFRRTQVLLTLPSGKASTVQIVSLNLDVCTASRHE